MKKIYINFQNNTIRVYKGPKIQNRVKSKKTKKVKPFYDFWLPINIETDIDFIFSTDLNTFGLTIKDKDKLLYVISRITNHYFIHKYSYDERYVAICSHVLRLVFNSKKVHSVLQFLLYHKILFSNNSYVVNQTSRRYKLNDIYRNPKTVKYTCNNVWIANKLLKHEHDTYKNIQIKGVEYDYLKESLNHISFDYNGALEEINFFLQFGVLFPDDKGEEKPFSQLQYDAYLSCINRLNAEIMFKRFFFKVSKTGNRLFTTIVNLPRVLRKFIKIDEKRIVGIDINNSQPLLINLLIENYMLSKPKNSHNLQMDWDCFKELTEKGIFYKVFELLCIYNGYKSKYKGEFKKAFFEHLLFSKTTSFKDSVIKKTFTNTFPEIYNLLVSLKKPLHNHLSIRLQEEESKLIINKICRNLSVHSGFDLTYGFKEYNIDNTFNPVFTIHDAIYCTEDFVDVVIAEIFQEFGKHNLTPSFSIVKY